MENLRLEQFEMALELMKHAEQLLETASTSDISDTDKFKL